jgi:hypothetical protein
VIQDVRVLRIYCPAHKTSSLTARESRIVCDSGGEALAWSFPHEKFWGYCCDCLTFWPSGIQKGRAIDSACPVCGREAARSYLCGFCKVISLDSDDAAKRKPFNVSRHGPIDPSCPGCLKTATNPARQHRCDEAVTEFSTTLMSCPFCSESLAEDLRRTEILSMSVQAPGVQRTLDVGSSHPAAGAPSGYRPADDDATPPPDSFATSATKMAPSDGSPSSTAEPAEPKKWVRPFLIVALVLSLGTVTVLTVLLIRLGTSAGQLNLDTASSGATPAAASANQASRLAPGPNGTQERPRPSTPAAPIAGAKLAYCRSNQVFLRSQPYLDENQENVIAVLSRNQKLWALSTSTNYNTTYIRSAGGDVTDNWTEVQLHDDPSVRGWVFSYFVLY